MTKQKAEKILKQVQNDKNVETGRSMTEMLGVLAIIGVLSIGGIAGYTYAMERHYTNEILNAASQRAIVIASQIAAGRQASLTEFDGQKEVAGGTFDSTVEEWVDGFGIKVTGVKESVCQKLLKATEGTDIVLAKTDGADLTDADCAGGSFLIAYSNDLGKGEEGETNNNKCLQEDYAKENICECTPNSCDCETYAKANPSVCCQTTEDFYGKEECCELSQGAVWAEGYGCCMSGETESQACCEAVNGTGSILSGSTCCAPGSDQGDCCYITGGGMLWTGSQCCKPGDEMTIQACCNARSDTHWDVVKGICCYSDAWNATTSSCYD